MSKFNKLYSKWAPKIIVEGTDDAAMPPAAEGDQSNLQPTDVQSQQPAPQEETEKLAPAAEVMLLRDLLKALVMTIPSDAEVMELVSTKVPDKFTKTQSVKLHESVNKIMDKYKDYENNRERIELANKVVINESNRRMILKKVLDALNKYS